MSKEIIVISPSGNYYGSEQVLQDYLQSTSLFLTLFVPNKSQFFKQLISQKTKHSLNGFTNLYRLYAKVIVQVLFKKALTVYSNEGGHIKWLILLAKLFPKLNVVVHIRIIEDINRIPKILPKNIHLVTISQFMRRLMLDHKNVSLILDPYTFNYGFRETKVISDSVEIKVGIIGRVSKGKGIFKAYNLIKKIAGTQNFNVSFNFFGTITEDSKIIEVVNELSNLDYPKSRFLGFQEKREIYSQIHIIMHLCPDEPLGRIYFEAIDNNLPLIGFNSGGIGELGQIACLDKYLVDNNNEKYVHDMIKLIKAVIADYNNICEEVHLAKNILLERFRQENYNLQLNKILQFKNN